MLQEKFLNLFKKKSFLRIIQIIISTILISYIIYKSNFNSLIGEIYNIDPLYILLIFCLGYLSIIISSLKIKLILSEVKFIRILKSNFVSFFYGLFIPGSVSSDVLKFFYLKDDEKKKELLFGALLLDRITGLIAIMIFFFIGIYIYGIDLIRDIFVISQFKIFFILLSSIVIIILIFLFLYKFWRKIIIYIRKSIKFISKKFKIILLVQLLGLLFQFICIIMFYITLKAILPNVAIPLSFLFLIISFTALVSMIPISIQNIGVSESLYLFFLSGYGINYDNILLISLINYSLLLSKVIIGYLFINLNKSN